MDSLTQKQIERQSRSLQKYQEENSMLKLRLVNNVRSFKASKTMTSSDTIHRVQDQIDQFTRKIDGEKRRNQEMTEQLGALEADILARKQRIGGINASKENDALISRQLRRIQTRIDKALEKYNRAVGDNKKIKDEIEVLRKERVCFDKIYKKLERELHERKKEIAKCIEENAAAQKQRDHALKEMEDLQKEAQRKKEQFGGHWEDLSSTLQKHRAEAQASFELEEVEVEEPVFTEPHGKLTVEQENGLRKTIVKDKWTSLRDSNKIQQSAEKITQYKKLFEKLLSISAKGDVDGVIEAFLSEEDKIFSLFQYINELNSEVDITESQIVDCKEEIETIKGQDVNIDAQRKKLLRDLEEKLRIVDGYTFETEQRLQKITDDLGKLKSGIFAIFTRFPTSTAAEELLGIQGISDTTLLQYLGAVEQKICQLVYKDGQSPIETDHAPFATSYGKTPQRGMILPEKIVRNENLVDSIEDDRPLTRSELAQLMIQDLKTRDH